MPLVPEASYRSAVGRAEAAVAAFAAVLLRYPPRTDGPGDPLPLGLTADADPLVAVAAMASEVRVARDQAAATIRSVLDTLAGYVAADEAEIAAELARPLPLGDPARLAERDYRARLAMLEVDGMQVETMLRRVADAIEAEDGVAAEVWYDLTRAKTAGVGAAGGGAARLAAQRQTLAAMSEDVQRLVAPPDRRAALAHREVIERATGKRHLIAGSWQPRLLACHRYSGVDYFASCWSWDSSWSWPTPRTADTPEKLATWLGDFGAVRVRLLPNADEVHEARRRGVRVDAVFPTRRSGR